MLNIYYFKIEEYLKLFTILKKELTFPFKFKVECFKPYIIIIYIYIIHKIVLKAYSTTIMTIISERKLSALFFLFSIIIQCRSQETGHFSCPVELTKRLFNYTILSNKTLTNGKESYSPDLYWIDYEKNTAYGCMCNYSSKACIRKCCEVGKVLYGNLCTDSKTVEGSLTSLRLDKQKLDSELWKINKLEEAFYIVENMLMCPKGFNRIILNPEYPEDMFLLFKNGTLQRNPEQHYFLSDYCLDWTDYINNFSAILCESANDNATERTHPIGIFISVLFLLITLIVYAIIPELHNLHGKTLMCHMASLIVAYTGLVVHKFDFEYLSYNYVCISLGK